VSTQRSLYAGGIVAARKWVPRPGSTTHGAVSQLQLLADNRQHATISCRHNIISGNYVNQTVLVRPVQHGYGNVRQTRIKFYNSNRAECTITPPSESSTRLVIALMLGHWRRAVVRAWHRNYNSVSVLRYRIMDGLVATHASRRRTVGTW